MFEISRISENFHFSNKGKIPSSKKFKLKHSKSILIAQIGILIFFGGYFTGMPSSSGDNPPRDLGNPVGLFNSVHIVENLRGDSMGYTKAWKILPHESLKVNILNPTSIPDESIEIIKNTILSTETIEIENSLLHKGLPTHFLHIILDGKELLKQHLKRKLHFPQILKFPIHQDLKVILSLFYQTLKIILEILDIQKQFWKEMKLSKHSSQFTM